VSQAQVASPFATIQVPWPPQVWPSHGLEVPWMVPGEHPAAATSAMMAKLCVVDENIRTSRIGEPTNTSAPQMMLAYQGNEHIERRAVH